MAKEQGALKLIIPPAIQGGNARVLAISKKTAAAIKKAIRKQNEEKNKSSPPLSEPSSEAGASPSPLAEKKGGSIAPNQAPAPLPAHSQMPVRKEPSFAEQYDVVEEYKDGTLSDILIQKNIALLQGALTQEDRARFAHLLKE